MVDTSVPEEEDEVGASRSTKRVERREVQDRLEALGARLTTLTERGFASLELGEEIANELAQLMALSSGSALARQRRRVAALLRGHDLDDLERRVHDAARGISVNRVHRLERLRRELIEEGDEAASRLFDKHPDLDRQRLGQAVRAARREAEGGVPGRHHKHLFQVLKDLGLGQE